jgi:hypothetical protein
MSDFEGIVRPFQLPNSATSQNYITAKQQSQPAITLYFGRGGSGRTFNASYSKRVSRYLDQQANEKTR